MNAQTVVDTFAPFVGTEGLRGIRNLKLSECGAGVKFYRHPYGMTILPPDLAHGFLLSRLAEGLAERTWTIHLTEDDRWIADNNYGDGVADIGDSPDYLSAILAAARMEWPKREEKEQPTIPRRMVFDGCFRCDEYHTEADGTIVVTKATITEGSLSSP